MCEAFIVASGENSEVKHKLLELEPLAGILDELRTRGKSIVQCHGVFDMLHVGHIRHFQQARNLGDVLIVTVTPDQHVNKGPQRPVFGEQLRAEAIAALESVDYVAINQWPDAVPTIELLQPDIYLKGIDYKKAEEDITGGIQREQDAVQAGGGKLAFTDDITFSSSHLLNRHLPVFSDSTREYLAGFSSTYSAHDITAVLDRAQELRVLVIGETIIDEYVYCETMGKSGKEPVLAARLDHTEQFAGGVLAVANHVAAFCDKVSLVTALGERDANEAFIEEKLSPKIQREFVRAANSATIIKRRFVELYPPQKLFELYLMKEVDATGELAATHPPELEPLLNRLIPDHDLVIVVDYGHGLVDVPISATLDHKSKFLAVNVQINAGNHGFNTISKYNRADYICISEAELRLDARSRYRPLTELMEMAASKHECEKVLITRGNQGCITYAPRAGFNHVPSFGIRVVDRVGAGDTVLAVTSLLAALDAPMEMVGVVGNAAGAEAVSSAGIGAPLSRVPFYRHLETLLK